MTASLSRASNNKIGTCPHGLPLGACPICNGMGGGGSVKKDNKPKEMSWNECYAIGQMLKAQKAARQQTLQMYAAQDLQAHLNKIQEQINAIKTMAMNNLPKPIAKAVTFLADAVLMPAVRAMQSLAKGMQNLMTTINKTIDNIKQKLTDISDKLNAIIGEAKAAIQKKIDEKFKDIKKKVFNLFGILEAENEEDDEAKKIEETRLLLESTFTKETELDFSKNIFNENPQLTNDESEK